MKTLKPSKRFENSEKKCRGKNYFRIVLKISCRTSNFSKSEIRSVFKADVRACAGEIYTICLKKLPTDIPFTTESLG